VPSNSPKNVEKLESDDAVDLKVGSAIRFEELKDSGITFVREDDMRGQCRIFESTGGVGVLDYDRDAVGAIVTLQKDGEKYVQQITSGDGYHASNSREILFPITEEHVYELSIKWPSGHAEHKFVSSTDKIITIIESR
jgi:hypothetical protein